MDISLITSLYRSDRHMEAYQRRVLAVHHALQMAGITWQLLMVMNDSTPAERATAQKLAQQGVAVVPIETARETLYASWNRGVLQAQGALVGFWNADDVRYSSALIEAHQHRAQHGGELFYGGWVERYRETVLGIVPFERREVVPAPPFDRLRFRSKMRLGAFFLFAPTLYGRVGAFDPHFKICGDYDWAVRACELVDPVRLSALCGEFIQDGTNLSAGTNPLQAVEDNVTVLRQGWVELLKPADPTLMREVWEAWGAGGRVLAPAQQAYLWGEGATERWQTAQNAAQEKRRQATLRYLPRRVVEQLGLRPLLQRLGVLKG